MDTEIQQTDPVTVLASVQPEQPSDVVATVEIANKGGAHQLVSHSLNPDKVEVSVQTTSANTDTMDSDCEEEDALSPVLRDERRRMERDTRAILAWANTFLKQRRLVVKSLMTDFRDGVHLINLLEVAYHERVGTYNPRPKRLHHRIDNLNVGFAYMEKEHGIKLININSVDVANGVAKPTIAMLQLLLRGLTMDSVSRFGGKANKNLTVRQHLLQWASESFADGIPVVKIDNFWESFTSGIAISAIVEKLCPGTIDVASLEECNAQANLQQAFTVANEHLGIPALLSAEDFLGRPDERAVESYVSMLVSAAAGNRKKHEEMKKKAELMEEIRAAQKAELVAEISAEKERFTVVMGNVEQLKAESVAAAQKEKELESKLEDNTMQISLYELQVNQLTQSATSTHTLLQKTIENENELRENLTKTRHELREANDVISKQADEIARLNADIYAMHLDSLDSLNRFRDDENQRRSIRMHASKNPNVKNNLEQLRDVSALEERRYSDFMRAIPSRSGFLMKLRLGGFKDMVIKNKPKKRFFTLVEDVLYHAASKDTSRSSWRAIKLSGYERVSIDCDSANANQPKLLKLIPKAGAKKNVKAYELGVYRTAIEEQEDLIAWADDINNRIALCEFRNEDEPDDRSGMCPELVALVSDPLRNKLLVQDRARDLHRALLHFREPLIRRQGLLSIVLDNVALTDDSVEVLASIIPHNSSIRNLELPRNLITSAGAQKLADAMHEGGSVSSLQLLDLTDNNIGDRGLTAIAAELPKFPTLNVLRLEGNGIGDEGVSALCTALLQEASGERSQGEREWTSLNLNRNLLGDVGCAAIASLISANASLTSLHLSHNRITDAGLEQLMNAVTESKRTLSTCLLASNQLSSKGIVHLASAVAKMPSVARVVIDLSHNQMIGRKGISALLNADVPIKFEGFRIVRGAELDSQHPPPPPPKKQQPPQQQQQPPQQQQQQPPQQQQQQPPQQQQQQHVTAVVDGSSSISGPVENEVADAHTDADTPDAEDESPKEHVVGAEEAVSDESPDDPVEKQQ